MLATRLVLLGVGCGVVGWAVLEVLPRVVARDPAVPGSVVTIYLVPVLLGSLGIAVSRFRLDEIEPPVRRAAVQVAVAALVGSAFIVLVRAVDFASDISAESMLAGGLVALVLLPWRSPCSAARAGSCTATASCRDAWCPTCAGSTRDRTRGRPCRRC